MADTDSPSLSLGARRYAGALFAAAEQSACLSSVADNIRILAERLDESADFRRFIASPLFDAGAQLRFIAAFNKAAGLAAKPGAAASGKLSADAVVGRFLTVLAEHRRLNLLPQVIAAFNARAEEARGEVDLYITTAIKLSAAQEKRLLNSLEKAAEAGGDFGKYPAGKKKILHKRVDPALLGGFIVRCGSLLIDTSLRSKLSSLKLALKEVG